MDTRVGGIRTARLMAMKAHKGMKYGEMPYFAYHVMNVVKRLYADPDHTEELVKIAYLHDTVEDTTLTLRVIRIAFGDRIAEAVDAMTRRDGEVYADYIERVAENELAAKVKVHDLRENMEHCWGTAKETLIPRYKKALNRLKEVTVRA